MNKLTLPIVSGRQYVLRDGFVATAGEIALTAKPVKEVDKRIHMMPSGDHVYVATGRYWKDLAKETMYDLVADFDTPHSAKT